MRIQREKYIIMRNNRTEVLCDKGSMGYFSNIAEETARIRTYGAERHARRCVRKLDGECEIVKVNEIYATAEEEYE